MPEAPHQSKTKLLDATLTVVRRKGYSATRVEDVCAEAGVTKGSFFHHFDSKEDLALAAADHWREKAERLFNRAEFNDIADPLERILAYIDFRKSLLGGDAANYTCFAGTVIQETYATHPNLSDACERAIAEHTAWLTPVITAAMRKYRVRSDWTATSLARHTQVVLQGAFILAKAEGQAKVAADSVDHLRRYIELLFRENGNAEI
ncbi:TetR/AcrR family transcriptional regulator [Bradyrhizobium sp. LHD-71]|uniref:TetR/AcrR family transcriptional regulator n=1 Tax=Bradyrhizobium sp. LHD-71 TaxID=3072141 RepID=UPI00280F953C|nr:TetR/AcrR family transcriptional regulator [Bradyrhizobium sp. LHD-71]MDQ8731644.1 TetR/AcrR family transcriptional regulator [Bradyrhizobium sp. LHD-71]